EARGALMLVARPAEPESKLSFAGLSDLLSGLPEEHFAAVPAPQRDALEVALLRVPSARAPGRRLVGTALLSLLRAVSAAREVVLAVDDLQWLDRPSGSALEFALRRLGDEPVRAILSLRRGEPTRTLLAEVARDGRMETLELGPLSLASLHRIVSNALGRAFPRPTLVRIARASGGNPLYALEIARLLDGEKARLDPGGLPVPDSLHALVAGRVRALPERTRDALLRAAALARPDVRLVDEAALGPAEEAGLVRLGADGRIEFVHPLFASAVYSSAASGRRRAVHRELASMLTDPEERARHSALASDGPDERVAKEVEAAARAARARGAPDTAAELAELALELVPEGSPARDGLRLDLVEHLYLASDFRRASEVLEGLRHELVGDGLARGLLILAEIDYWRTGESAAVALSEEALTAARDPLLQARCQAAIAMYAGTIDLGKAAASARAALGLLERRSDAEPVLVAAALSARIRADLFLGRGFDRRAAERALELDEQLPPATVDTRVVFKLGQWLRYVDDLSGARDSLARAERAAHEEGDDSSLANILLNRMVVETWAGDWQEAASLCERMSDTFDQLGVESQGIDPWRAYVDAHAGRVEAVRRLLRDSRPAQPIVAMIRSRCLGLAELASGDAESAHRHLSDAVAELDRVDFREPAIWRVDGDAIEAALAAGDLDGAERLLARFEERAARSRIPWSVAVCGRCRGLVLTAHGELEVAQRALERALAEHERSPTPFERARTLLVLGQVRRRLKRKRAARASLEWALAIFERLGAEPWVERATAELGRVTVRRAPEDLSPTELRIARLAASGLTNETIAREVFLTRKTVEANLSRTYRKLGIRSRAQLAQALDSRGARGAESG
ncbi:MAG: hypothetical protein C5B48_09855, partial [Candidatus Rokuibacteriota bacterium]